MAGMDEIFLCMRVWLQECKACHEKCQIKRDMSLSPRRFIYLRDEMTSTEDLQLISSHNKIVNYCALSYCWGTSDKNFGKTDTTNIRRRESGFSSKDLPRTLQDTVVICRRLGLSYLWIDSLCIKQDDLSEWKTESLVMGQIYGNSTLTLIAAASNHANDGLFNPRLQANNGTWLPSVPEAIGYTPWSWISPWARDGQGIDGVLRSGVSTVSGRGWTLQEEFTSPRDLFWTRNGLLWTCPTRVQREWVNSEARTQLRNLGHIESSAFYYPEFLSQRHHTFVLLRASPETARIAWMEALSEYLRRQLSNDDRLAAIAGLVSVLRPQLKDEYTAGLWSTSIAEDLLWGRVSHPYQRTFQMKPSWSWASLPAGSTADAWLGFDARSAATVTCSILDIQVNPQDASVCGPLKGGHLQIRAQKELFLQRQDRTWEPYMGSGFSGTAFHIATDIDVEVRPSDQDFWDRVECVKVLELHGREFCLLIVLDSNRHDSEGNCVFRRVGRAEIIPRGLTYSIPLLHGQKFGLGLPGYGEGETRSYFKGCSDCIINLV